MVQNTKIWDPYFFSTFTHSLVMGSEAFVHYKTQVGKKR